VINILMTQFNFFGCTTDDIKQAFPGAVDKNFSSRTMGVSAVTIYDSTTMLNRQLDLATSKVTNKLNDNVLQTLKYVKGIKPVYDVDTGRFQIPTELPLKNDLRVFVLKEFYDRGCFQNYDASHVSFYSGGYFTGTNSLFSFNNPSLDTFLITDLTPATVTMSGTTSFSIDDYVYNQDDTIVMNYRVDEANISLPSLAGVVRDIAAAEVGMSLYSTTSSQWSLVDKFMADAKAGLDMMDD
jgi:hypothetical protein